MSAPQVTSAASVCARCNGRRQGRFEFADESPFAFPDEKICSACEADVIAVWRAQLAREDAVARVRQVVKREDDEDDYPICSFCNGACLNGGEAQ